jgi:DNA-binding MarR family transcriptional regulator
MDRPYGISDFAFPSRWDRESGPDLVERAGQTSRRDREPGQAERERGSNSTRSRGGFDRPLTIYRGRDREYPLRESEVRTLSDLGKFRVVPEDDLARFGYRGNRTQMESDVRSLSRQGLVERHMIEGHSSYSTKVLTLTKDGQRLLERAQLVSNRQATYHGLVKPKEARHDADLYRLYQKVAREIERSGGKVRRVILDFELKKDLYQALSRTQPDKDPRYERIFIANQFDLKVVDGKIPIPDLRIEYEDDCRDVRRLDLEIATRDYRPQGLDEKARAGFHMFARQQDHAKLRRVLDTQEISARIFAL